MQIESQLNYLHSFVGLQLRSAIENIFKRKLHESQSTIETIRQKVHQELMRLLQKNCQIM